MTKNIEERIREIVSRNIQTNVDLLKISLDENLFDIGMTSINGIKILVEVENEFGFEIEEDDLLLADLKTLRQMIAFVEKKCSSSSENNE